VVTEAAAEGFGGVRVIVSLTFASSSLLALIAVERASRHPMIPPTILRSRTFVGVNLLTVCLYAALGAATFVLPFTLIQIHRYSIVEATASMLPFVIVMALLSRWAGWLRD